MPSTVASLKTCHPRTELRQSRRLLPQAAWPGTRTRLVQRNRKGRNILRCTLALSWAGGCSKSRFELASPRGASAKEF